MNVSFGWASRIGVALTALAAAAPLLGEIADAAAPLGVPPVVWVKVAALLAVVTIAGRMLQAVAAVWGRSAGPGTVVATTGAGDIQASGETPSPAVADPGRLRAGEQLVDPTPTTPTDAPLR